MYTDSYIKEKEYACRVNRDVIYVGSTTIYLSGTIKYRTGFNVYSQSTDVDPDTYGFSDSIEWTVSMNAVYNLGALAGALAVSLLL